MSLSFCRKGQGLLMFMDDGTIHARPPSVLPPLFPCSQHLIWHQQPQAPPPPHHHGKLAPSNAQVLCTEYII